MSVITARESEINDHEEAVAAHSDNLAAILDQIEAAEEELANEEARTLELAEELENEKLLKELAEAGTLTAEAEGFKTEEEREAEAEAAAAEEAAQQEEEAKADLQEEAKRIEELIAEAEAAQSAIEPGEAGYPCARAKTITGENAISGEEEIPRPECKTGLCCGGARKIQTPKVGDEPAVLTGPQVEVCHTENASTYSYQPPLMDGKL